ncbi:MAG: hypothetical protein IT372_33075, partial [Polyangiaceae bacterium]|nr:hypothetical protein [Polyangiaceae bacterium]
MSRRVLIVEPDAAGRAMMDRALGADGYAAEAVASIAEARGLLDAGRVDVAIIDELADAGAARNGQAAVAGAGPGALDAIRAVRRAYPTLPVVAAGTALSPRALVELIRLGVADALPKPFTPAELRDAVRR